MKWLPFLSLTLLLVIVGCATTGGTGGTAQPAGINWALAKNGGRISAFSEDPEHPVSTLINGITSSEAWDQGEGWQAQISQTVAGRRTARNVREEEERNWVIIELSQPVTVNHVRIYTIDSEKYPASKFGVSDVLVQYELKTAANEMIWANVKRLGKRIGDQDDTVRNNTSGVIDVRFEPVNTQRLRLLIFSTNDMKMSDDSSRTREGTIRLIEVQVYGSGKLKERDKLDEIFER